MDTATKPFPSDQTVNTLNASDSLDINTRTTPGRTNPGKLFYAPNTQQRLVRLSGSATWIFEDVLLAMQTSEELGGPIGEEYFALMQAIIDEASERAANYRAVLAESC